MLLAALGVVLNVPYGVLSGCLAGLDGWMAGYGERRCAGGMSGEWMA